MITFWKNDFRYIKRNLYSNFETGENGYMYTFSLCGESLNYLINKYKPEYPDIKLYLFTSDKTATLTSKTLDGLKRDVIDIEANDTLKLFSLLQETIDIDMKNYEEYMCDDFYPRDSRWE